MNSTDHEEYMLFLKRELTHLFMRACYAVSYVIGGWGLSAEAAYRRMSS